MAVAAFALYALGHLVLFGAALGIFLKFRTRATVVLLLVTAGLVYDNALLALGAAIGHGPVLETLSVPRFFLHALTTPLLMLTGLAFLQRAGADWSRRTLVIGALVVVTLAMIGWGFWTDMVQLVLAPESEAGIVSYGNAAASGLPLAPMVTIVVLIAIAIALWRHGAGPWLLLAALVQFAIAALGDVAVFAGNFGELALLAGLVFTDWRLARRNGAGG